LNYKISAEIVVLMMDKSTFYDSVRYKFKLVFFAILFMMPPLAGL